MEQEIKNMRKDIDQLKQRIEVLTKVIQELTNTCSKMDTHINFVEGTYETLRSPLDFLTRQVNKFNGIEHTQDLPLLK
jgi:archaellum component FlaC